MSSETDTTSAISLDARTARNKAQVAFLCAGFGAVVFVVFALLLLTLGGGWFGLFLAAFIAIAWLIIAWSRSADVALDLSDVEPADEQLHARFFNTTAGMSATVGVSAPALYVVEDSALNAMAVGRDARNASLVVTTGLLEKLTVIELESVVAFELLRIKLGDIAPQTLLVATFGAPVALAESADRYAWAQRILRLPVPLLERALVWLHTGRKDVDLDLATVRFTRYPPALADALAKMEGKSALAMGTPATAHLWAASPLGLTGPGALSKIHVPLQSRIAVLREL